MKTTKKSYSNCEQGDNEYGFDFTFIETWMQGERRKTHCYYAYHDNGRTVDGYREFDGTFEEDELTEVCDELIGDFCEYEIDNVDARLAFIETLHETE